MGWGWGRAAKRLLGREVGWRDGGCTRGEAVGIVANWHSTSQLSLTNQSRIQTPSNHLASTRNGTIRRIVRHPHGQGKTRSLRRAQGCAYRGDNGRAGDHGVSYLSFVLCRNVGEDGLRCGNRRGVRSGVRRKWEVIMKGNGVPVRIAGRRVC